MNIRNSVIGLALFILLGALFGLIAGQSNRIYDLEDNVKTCKEHSEASLADARAEAEDMILLLSLLSASTLKTRTQTIILRGGLFLRQIMLLTLCAL